MLQEKIQKLEHLCDLKDKRIEDMSDKLVHMKGPRGQPPAQQGRMGPGRAKQQQPPPGGYYRGAPPSQPRWN